METKVGPNGAQGWNRDNRPGTLQRRPYGLRDFAGGVHGDPYSVRGVP